MRMHTNAKSMEIHSIQLKNFKYLFGTIFLVSVWVFPFSDGSSRDALQQIYALGVLSSASLLFGLGSISKRFSAIILGASLCVLIAPSPYLGDRIAGASALLLFGVSCHFGINIKQKSNALEWLLIAIVISAFFNAIEGLLQWFGLVGDLSPWVVEPENRGIAFGAFRQRNLFATFVCVGAVCTVWLVLKRRLTEPMAWFILLVLMFAIAASGSRTGLLEVLALSGLGALWKKQQAPAITRLMVGQSIILGLALLTLSKTASWLEFGFASGVERAAQMGMDGRLTIWSNAIDLIAERPWFGWGWRETGYGHYVTLFSHHYDVLMDNVHNLPLQLAVEFGLPFSIIFFAVLIRSFFLAKPWHVEVVKVGGLIQPASDRHFAWAVLLLIVGIHSMLEYPLCYVRFLFLTGLAVGYVFPTKSHVQVSIDCGYDSLSKLIAKLSSVSLIILSLLAWQQYLKVLPIYKIPFTNDRGVYRQAMTTAMAGASDSWLFQAQLDFTTLTLMEVTSHNAAEIKHLAEKLLHHSAEPRVIQPLLLSLWYLNDEAAFRFHAERFCYAFPTEFKNWSEKYANHPIFQIWRISCNS